MPESESAYSYLTATAGVHLGFRRPQLRQSSLFPTSSIPTRPIHGFDLHFRNFFDDSCSSDVTVGAHSWARLSPAPDLHLIPKPLAPSRKLPLMFLLQCLSQWLLIRTPIMSLYRQDFRYDKKTCDWNELMRELLLIWYYFFLLVLDDDGRRTCSSHVLSSSREESGDEELFVLPRHTKVIVTGNNRTKSILVDLQGVVKKAVVVFVVICFFAANERALSPPDRSRVIISCNPGKQRWQWLEERGKRIADKGRERRCGVEEKAHGKNVVGFPPFSLFPHTGKLHPYDAADSNLTPTIAARRRESIDSYLSPLHSVVWYKHRDVSLLSDESIDLLVNTIGCTVP
ncbi:hypothetical protein KSP40_PGU000287 [Platanthera guangdongensis]|uniref:Uncharacterized protein n=1 Tax=Platanthera guangdongensis TaxID=2320717 RepID=A0ABR2LSW1_9ASPA